MTVTIHTGDCLAVLDALPAGSAHACVTSPPYWGLRDYGHPAQLGGEATPGEYVAGLAAVFRKVRRVLRADGTVWLNLGDTYTSGGRPTRAPDAKNPAAIAARQPRPATPAGLKPKDLVGIPWMAAFALRADGWHLRQDVIWHKPNPMPESVTDRCTKAHETIFLLSKRGRYRFDREAIREAATGRPPGDTRNRRSVWTVATRPLKAAHFATYPPELIEPCILASVPPGGTVLDPFFGAGTTGLVAARLGRHAVGIELNPAYVEIARERLTGGGGTPAEVLVVAA